jgi:hypothetical protein
MDVDGQELADREEEALSNLSTHGFSGITSTNGR